MASFSPYNYSRATRKPKSYVYLVVSDSDMATLEAQNATLPTNCAVKLGRSSGDVKTNRLARYGHVNARKDLVIIYCNNAESIENDLITFFKTKYKVVGTRNETFVGNTHEMTIDFVNCVEASMGLYVDNEVKALFPNYWDDECFHGKQNLIHTKYVITDYGITLYVYELFRTGNRITCYKNTYTYNATDNNSIYFFNQLISNNVITNNGTYNCNSEFKDKVNKCKYLFNVYLTHNERESFSYIYMYQYHNLDLLFEKTTAISLNISLWNPNGKKIYGIATNIMDGEFHFSSSYDEKNIDSDFQLYNNGQWYSEQHMIDIVQQFIEKKQQCI